MKPIFNLLLFSVFITAISCTKTELTDAVPSPENGETDYQEKLVTYLTGDAADVVTTTSRGIVLMGGSSDVDEAIEWMIERSGGGDFVVIRSSGSDGYNDYIYSDLGGVNSVETIILDSRRKANRDDVYNKILNAEALFIAGGDQWNYVKYWRNTKVETAINYLLNTKLAPVGGTSAGCAIMGQSYFTAENGTVYSSEALDDPYNQYMKLGNSDFVNAPILANTITDTHYDNPDRRGRHTTFLARMIQDWSLNARGIGVEEETAVCIDENGIAKVYGYGNGTAFFLKQNNEGPETCAAGTKLTWNRNNQAVKVYKIENTVSGNGSFDLNDWTTASGGSWVNFWVDNGVFHED
jgi:cyanophycinase-like exopeptidase